MSVRPLRLILPLTVCAALLVGCGDDGDSSADPTSSPSQSATDSASSDAPAPSDPTSSEAPDGDSPDTESESAAPTAPVPADATELCGVFSTAYQAVVKGTGGLSDDESTPLPAELVDALHAWGDGLADADLPSSLSGDEKDGIGIMSRLLVAIPDDATGKDLATFDEKLSGSEDDKIEAASDWVDKTCNLDLS